MTDENTRLFESAEKVLPGGNTRSTLFVPPSAPYAVNGAGARVTFADGHTTIDCNNNYTALIHGHRPAAVLDAVRRTLEWGISFGVSTPLEITMAEALRERFPHMDQWRFGNSGTEAVMQAIRIARAATGRDVVVRFAGAYHGTSDAVVDPTAPGIPASISQSVIQIPVGDAGAFEETMALHGDRVAAVLVDLMPNRAGLDPVDPAFAGLLRRLTRQTGALLIVDEVISFRMEVGGLQQRYGIDPDLTTLGKAIGGGFPVGAVGGKRAPMAAVDPRRDGSLAWGGTFSANPVTLAAGLAAIGSYDAAAVADLNARGERLRARLDKEGFSTTGSGSLLRIWPGKDVREFWWDAYRAGVLLCSTGLLSLSTAMSDDDVTEIGDRLVSTLDPSGPGPDADKAAAGT